MSVLRDLVQGMRGEDVRAVQKGLNEYFAERRTALVPDGVFGANTRAAVDAFQKENPGTGKPDGRPDGIVGRRTRTRLFPLAVVTVSAVGMRLKMPTIGGGGGANGIKPPRLGPGPLQLPSPPAPPPFQPKTLQVDWSSVMAPAKLQFENRKYPGLRLPLPSPRAVLVPRPELGPLPNPPGPPGPPFPLGVVHHFELSPGSQVNLQKPSETSFTLALQGVAVIGKDGGPHQEFAMGTQLASANADGSGDWSVTWFAQITDVDRIGALGQFHLWQPYAQLGSQASFRAFSPVFTGSLFPVNVGFDFNDNLSVNVASGVAFTYDPQTGTGTAALQGTAGLVLKFDLPPKKK